MPKIKKDNNRTDSTYPQGIFTCPICGKEVIKNHDYKCTFLSINTPLLKLFFL